MNQEYKVLQVMYERHDAMTPKEWSKLMKIPTPTVRKHLAMWFKLGVVDKENPDAIDRNNHHTAYYTTKSLIKKHISSMKKEKRKLQCQIADKKYRTK